MPPVLVIAPLALFAALGAIAIWIARLYARIGRLERERAEKRDALTKTSKLLIDKNMELFDQNVRQQKQIESKEDFIGIVSHQLRTPATEVKWGLEALEGELAGHAEGAERAYFDKLKKSAERMVRLIDSLVRLMNVDEQFRRPFIAPYEPDPVIRRIAEDVAAKFAGKKRIELTLALGLKGPIESMDTDSLELVVENLVENAYEYTPDGGRVTIATARVADGGFTCSVADTGIGISKEKLSTVFVKFQRSETAMRMNSGGMGLGLYLVKNIVERHSGTVGFTSEEGKGTTFTFTLPPVRRLS